MITHDLVERAGEYACRVCRWRWTAAPADDCPGVQRYTWPTIPPELQTHAQLRRAGLTDLGTAPAMGCVWSDHLATFVWLYDRRTLLQPAPPAASRPSSAPAPAPPSSPAAQRPDPPVSAVAPPATCTICGEPERWMVTINAGVCDICRRQRLRQQAAAGPAQQRPGSAPKSPSSVPAGPRSGSRPPPLQRLSQPTTRQGIQAWASRLIEQGSGWVVLDTETTGIHRTAEVVDIAVVAPDGTVLLESLVRPSGSIQRGAAQVHGISSAQVRSAPSFGELYPRLQAVLADQIVLAFNCPFDGRILNFCCLQAGLPIIGVSWGCVMQAYKVYAAGQSYSLRAACSSFGLTQGTHRATADALATLHVLRAIASGQLPGAAPGSVTL